YPGGSTNRVNTALAFSCDIDTDGDGIVNCLDPTPFSVSPCVFVPVPIPPPSGQGGGGNSTNQPPGGNVSGLPILVPPAPPAPGPSNAPAAFVKGTYNGLFSSSNGVTWANAGSFMAKTTTKGNYSAKITLAGRSYSLAGKFDSASHR